MFARVLLYRRRITGTGGSGPSAAQNRLPSVPHYSNVRADVLSLASMITRFTLISIFTICIHALPRNSATFTHLHDFHLDEGAQAVFKNAVVQPPTVTLTTAPTSVYRPRNIDAYHHARRRSFFKSESEAVEWDLVDMDGPDMEDQHTVVQLGRMAGNAYATHPGQNNWYDLDKTWNVVSVPVYDSVNNH